MAKKRITTIYPRDKHALSALACCGYVSREQLGVFLREKRVQSYCKDGLIEKSIYSRPGTKAQDIEVYRLTKAGRELCRRELSLSTYCAQNPAHDLALADRYFSLSQTERETWRTESQSREDVSTEIRQLREQGEEERAGELWAKLQEGRLCRLPWDTDNKAADADRFCGTVSPGAGDADDVKVLVDFCPEV